MKQNKIRVITHIVVHCTGTGPMQVVDLGHLPYHFVVTGQGKLVNIRPVQRNNARVKIAWLGGIDETGSCTDNRTEVQKETLFSTLVLLTERFPEAKIVGADQLRKTDIPNPGFDVKKWLAEYIPAFMEAA